MNYSSRKTKHLLVLDGDMGSTLAIVRTLGAQGWIVDVASAETPGIASHSRFASASLVYPNSLTHENDFLTWCEDLLMRNAYDLIIPVTERTVVPLMKLRSTPGADKLAMASNEALETVLDKNKTAALAQSLQIPLPQNLTITNKDELQQFITENPLAMSARPGAPLVIKPGRSIGKGQEGRKKLEVQYAFTQEEARNKIDNLLPFGDVIIQEYFLGQGVGVELLASNGEIVYAFQHLRIHELPLTGGASCLRRSVPLEPALLAATTQLIQAMKWTGVAMVEFKWNPENKSFVLVEINGRFWGSLPLAIAAGADFPAMLCELLVEGKVQPRAPYNPKFYARNLFTDLQWYELVLRKQTPQQFRGIWEDKKRLVVDTIRIFSWNHRLDNQRWSDPVPSWMDLKKIANYYIKRVSDILAERKTLRFHQSFWKSGKVQQEVRSAKKVLFVCYGNINRSALSERYFKKAFPNSTLEVISAGFHPHSQRPADPVMVQEAKAVGVNMEGWSSYQLTQEMMQTSDVIFVMEDSHWQRIKAEYPAFARKTFLLGFAASTDLEKGEIEDPYSKPRKNYQTCISEVCVCIDNLINILKNTNP